MTAGRQYAGVAYYGRPRRRPRTVDHTPRTAAADSREENR